MQYSFCIILLMLLELHVYKAVKQEKFHEVWGKLKPYLAQFKNCNNNIFKY